MTREPRRGDMIEFKRGLYSHFGVYVGNDNVIHLIWDKGWSSSSTSKPEVKEELLEDVARGSHYEVNNTRESELKAFDGQTIIDIAKMCIGPVKYHPAKFNCETFASVCRYGRGRSKQADRICRIASVTTDELMTKWKKKPKRRKIA